MPQVTRFPAEYVTLLMPDWWGKPGRRAGDETLFFMPSLYIYLVNLDIFINWKPAFPQNFPDEGLQSSFKWIAECH